MMVNLFLSHVMQSGNLVHCNVGLSGAERFHAHRMNIHNVKHVVKQVQDVCVFLTNTPSLAT